jgi:hypothetical protein
LHLAHGLGHTIYFSDRPARIVGATPTATFYQRLGFTPENPPNAVLVVEAAPGQTEVVALVLYAPHFDPTTFDTTYEVEVLAEFERTAEAGFAETETDLAELLPPFGPSHLFIDDLACGEHAVGCFLDGYGVGDIGKRGYHLNGERLICRPSAGCPELNATCNATFPECQNNCYAAQLREGPWACSSCLYSIEDLNGRFC